MGQCRIMLSADTASEVQRLTVSFCFIDQHILQVMDVNVPIALINRTFIQNGLEVSEAHMCEDTLEDYFKQVTGGEGIA